MQVVIGEIHIFCAIFRNAPFALQVRHLCSFPAPNFPTEPARVFVDSKNRAPSANHDCHTAKTASARGALGLIRPHQPEEHRAVGCAQRDRHLIRLRRTRYIYPVCAEADGKAVRLRLQLPARVVREPVKVKVITQRGTPELRGRG